MRKCHEKFSNSWSVIWALLLRRLLCMKWELGVKQARLNRSENDLPHSLMTCLHTPVWFNAVSVEHTLNRCNNYSFTPGSCQPLISPSLTWISLRLVMKWTLQMIGCSYFAHNYCFLFICKQVCFKCHWPMYVITAHDIKEVILFIQWRADLPVSLRCLQIHVVYVLIPPKCFFQVPVTSYITS